VIFFVCCLQQSTPTNLVPVGPSTSHTSGHSRNNSGSSSPLLRQSSFSANRGVVYGPPPTGSVNSSYLQAHAEDEEMRHVMELSRKVERPGVERVAGSGPNPATRNAPPVPSNLNRDVTGIPPDGLAMLVAMGFTQDQAIHALRMKNNDVAAAADFLLSGE
jgi:hypothetical protein